MNSKKQIIGRWDCVDFVDFKLKDVRVKIDTGAYTSSLRCAAIEEIKTEDGNLLRFTVLDPAHPHPIEKRIFETSDYRTKVVKNSGGIATLRYSIKTTIRIFNEEQLVEFTLARRKGMKFPVLLGRKFLGNRYLVDPNKTLLSFKQRNH
jgi:hypothetical protein